MSDVTHVRIHSSVKAIKNNAFNGREKWRIVILNDGLEEIGEQAFSCHKSLECIVIPNTVKIIKRGAFEYC
jgi:hypothetical protein